MKFPSDKNWSTLVKIAYAFSGGIKINRKKNIQSAVDKTFLYVILDIRGYSFLNRKS